MGSKPDDSSSPLRRCQLDRDDHPSSPDTAGAVDDFILEEVCLGRGRCRSIDNLIVTPSKHCSESRCQDDGLALEPNAASIGRMIICRHRDDDRLSLSRRKVDHRHGFVFNRHRRIIGGCLSDDDRPSYRTGELVRRTPIGRHNIQCVLAWSQSRRIKDSREPTKGIAVCGVDA